MVKLIMVQNVEIFRYWLRGKSGSIHDRDTRFFSVQEHSDFSLEFSGYDRLSLEI